MRPPHCRINLIVPNFRALLSYLLGLTLHYICPLHMPLSGVMCLRVVAHVLHKPYVNPACNPTKSRNLSMPANLVLATTRREPSRTGRHRHHHNKMVLLCDGGLAINLLSSVVMNGVCCLHNLSAEEERNREQQEELRRTINVE